MRKHFLFLLFLLIFLVACSNEEEATSNNEEQKEQDNTTEQTEQIEEPKQEPEFENVYPLTGIRTNDPVNDRIVSVMVNNATQARPQTGLTKADIVFEILAEGPITRFIAFFQSEKPEVVGPVRSAREYYYTLAANYNALYIYHGAADFIEDRLRAGVVDNLNGAYYDNDGNLFKRANFREPPHNSYVLFPAIYDVAKEQGYEVKADYTPLPFLDDEEVETIDGGQATDVEIVYYPEEIVTYQYDSSSQQYVRYSDGSKTVELETEEAVSVDNVFIVETRHEVIDDAGRRSVDLQSGGNAYLLQKGKLEKLQWRNEEGRIVPYKDGQPVGFVPGKTWVNVIPEDPGLNGAVTIQ
ncbi:DUF3048 domain-containing protein [Aquibacillus sp. 3ASR75-11]|uniref:DUF3048 domain-containing protein n=1 Tax=Terrihalobacillus insolitus TaxID=2950438 RepID=A0A9X3WV53_9BACI|nr:DUF3048 domain-containing protein [Terrihalobacillus insolitus]MDC3414192.1 DUF3048 domain-containing protein [Terrihalobacillus insolitus]MDC3425398.1 DUF3048 domain-containing protein [Terrihalobacillus insolitus]